MINLWNSGGLGEQLKALDNTAVTNKACDQLWVGNLIMTRGHDVWTQAACYMTPNSRENVALWNEMLKVSFLLVQIPCLLQGHRQTRVTQWICREPFQFKFQVTNPSVNMDVPGKPSSRYRGAGLWLSDTTPPPAPVSPLLWQPPDGVCSCMILLKGRRRGWQKRKETQKREKVRQVAR